jgi:hypothetical protein
VTSILRATPPSSLPRSLTTTDAAAEIGGVLATKKKVTTASAAGPGRKRGYVKAMVRLTPEQLDALRQVAARRALERGSGQLDASEVIREALDAWFARHGKK